MVAMMRAERPERILSSTLFKDRIACFLESGKECHVAAAVASVVFGEQSMRAWTSNISYCIYVERGERSLICGDCSRDHPYFCEGHHGQHVDDHRQSHRQEI